MYQGRRMVWRQGCVWGVQQGCGAKGRAAGVCGACSKGVCRGAAGVYVQGVCTGRKETHRRAAGVHIGGSAGVSKGFVQGCVHRGSRMGLYRGLKEGKCPKCQCLVETPPPPPAALNPLHRLVICCVPGDACSQGCTPRPHYHPTLDTQRVMHAI